MIKNFVNFILSFFREIYVYKSYKNKKKIFYKNYLLKKYRSNKSIDNKSIAQYLKAGNKSQRFKNDQTLLVLLFKKKAVCFGWMNKTANWKITEIDKIIFNKKTLILYDFFTYPIYRNKGFYTKILNLIKNINTKNKFLIYCLKNNEKSKKGIVKAKFYLVDKIKRI